MPGSTRRQGITEPAAMHSTCRQKGWTPLLSGKRGQRGTPTPLASRNKGIKTSSISTWLQAFSGPGQAACVAKISVWAAGPCSNEHLAAVQHLLPEAEHQQVTTAALGHSAHQKEAGECVPQNPERIITGWIFTGKHNRENYENSKT